MFRPAKELIEGCTAATKDLARQICHNTLAENAEETVANLILVAYLVTLAHNDIRPQDTNKEDDFSLIDQCLSVISNQIETIKFAQIITDTEPEILPESSFEDSVDRLRDIQTDRDLENDLPEKWA